MTDKFELVTEEVSLRNTPAVTLSRVGLPMQAPRIIVLHGLYSRKEAYLEELLLLARKGFRATAVDLALHGENIRTGNAEQALQMDYIAGMQSIVYETAKDIVALLDFWGAQEGSVGLLAISAGGLAAHAVAVSDSRIGAFAAIITSPDWLTADPRLEIPALSPVRLMLAKMSPVNKPERYPPIALLMIVAELDDIVSPAGSILLYGRLQPLYERLGISDSLKLVIEPDAGHKYTPDMRRQSVEWLERHLLKK